MKLPGDNRLAGVRIHHDREDYRLRLSVRQFAHRMRAAAIIAVLFFALVAYVARLLSHQMGVEFPAIIALTAYFIVWLYLASLPLLFGLRTRLFGYVFQEHWMWLAVWFALPLDYFVVQFQFKRWPWIPILFLGSLLLGWLLRSGRNERFSKELHRQINLWEQLLPLGILDLLTLNFWSVRRHVERM